MLSQIQVEREVGSQLSEEMSVEQALDMTCHKCNRTFSEFEELRMHVRGHRNAHQKDLQNPARPKLAQKQEPLKLDALQLKISPQPTMQSLPLEHRRHRQLRKCIGDIVRNPPRSDDPRFTGRIVGFKGSYSLVEIFETGEIKQMRKGDFVRVPNFRLVGRVGQRVAAKADLSRRGRITRILPNSHGRKRFQVLFDDGVEATFFFGELEALEL